MSIHIPEQGAVARWVHRHRQHRLVRAAIERASAAFARRYPQWTAALFDQHLIARAVAPGLLTPAPHAALTPHDLAAAWAAQLSSRSDRQQMLQAQCLPVAAEFLRLLRQELPAVPSMLPLLGQHDIGGRWQRLPPCQRYHPDIVSALAGARLMEACALNRWAGLAAQVTISGAKATNDRLTVPWPATT